MSAFTTDRPAFTFHAGHLPLLVSFPHAGTYVPPCVFERLTDEARHVPDTDWHLPQLYAFVRAMGASTLVATHSRYVVDLNRSPDGASLYPGQSVTGLCPVDTFDDTPLYQQPALQPNPEEIDQRRAAVWQPYHDQLRAELDRLRAAHGAVVLWDAHSIRSVLPRFFEGKLPDLNLGTNKGYSCHPALAEQLLQVAQGAAVDGLSAVLNGRFTGGYITRHYGQPAQGFHAVQLEMTQSSYMQEALPFDYLPQRAAQVQPHLQKLLQAALDFAQRPSQG